MAETNKEKKLSLKIMVDVKAKKVVLAEADKEFVDYIFNLMSMPLSSVTKVLLCNEMGMVGTLGALYKSIESLDTRCFRPKINSSSVLKPKSSVSVPLLSLHDWPAATCRIFKCSNHNLIADVRGSICCNKEMYELPYTYISSKESDPDYVNGGAVYMVTDSLEVKPMSIVLVKSYIEEVDNLEEKEVEIGLQEGLAILKAPLETSSVLTTVFLKNI